MRLVGLSGGIATGKSTVSRLLVEADVPLVDADLIARRAVDKGRWGHRRVVGAFGPAVLRPDGEVDREALGALVFKDDAARRRLNGATHMPILLDLLLELLAAWARFRPLVVVDMPLLFETGFYRLCWPSVVVSCTEEAQLQRLMKRDGSTQAQAEARMRAQMPLAAKVARAQLVVDNSGSQEETASQVRGLHRQLSRGAGWQALLTSPLTLGLGQAVLLATSVCRHAFQRGPQERHHA